MNIWFFVGCIKWKPIWRLNFYCCCCCLCCCCCYSGRMKCVYFMVWSRYSVFKRWCWNEIKRTLILYERNNIKCVSLRCVERLFQLATIQSTHHHKMNTVADSLVQRSVGRWKNVVCSFVHSFDGVAVASIRLCYTQQQHIHSHAYTLTPQIHSRAHI